MFWSLKTTFNNIVLPHSSQVCTSLSCTNLHCVKQGKATASVKLPIGAFLLWSLFEFWTPSWSKYVVTSLQHSKHKLQHIPLNTVLSVLVYCLIPIVYLSYCNYLVTFLFTILCSVNVKRSNTSLNFRSKFILRDVCKCVLSKGSISSSDKLNGRNYIYHQHRTWELILKSKNTLPFQSSGHGYPMSNGYITLDKRH